MTELLKTVLEWLKKPVIYFLPLLAVSAFGLFAPFHIIEQLSISQWRTDGKLYLGSLFVVSFGVVFCHYFTMFINWVLKWNHFYRVRRVGHSRLKSLTSEEQEVLALYLKEKSKTQLLNPMSGVVTGLSEANIIYPSANESMSYKFPFNIREWAWIYLNKNPSLVATNVTNHSKNP